MMLIIILLKLQNHHKEVYVMGHNSCLGRQLSFSGCANWDAILLSIFILRTLDKSQVGDETGGTLV